MRTRKNHSAELKAKVALDAIREEMAFFEPSKKYGVHLIQIGKLKRAAIENKATEFTRRGAAPEHVMEMPWYGSRQIARFMQRNDDRCGRRLMRLIQLVPIFQQPNTSKKYSYHKIWPSLLRTAVINRPKQVWCTDITYVPMHRGPEKGLGQAGQAGNF